MNTFLRGGEGVEALPVFASIRPYGYYPNPTLSGSGNAWSLGRAFCPCSARLQRNRQDEVVAFAQGVWAVVSR